MSDRLNFLLELMIFRFLGKDKILQFINRGFTLNKFSLKDLFL
jgi:hypothetical protein